jgi:tetratricopeptide (TPR) repeat protein
MGERGQPNRPALAAALLAAATVAAYWPVVRGGFVFDDDPLILTNPCVTTADGLRRIWLTDENYDYLPITYTAFRLEYQLWGANPLGYHLVSLGLHAANAVLLWLLLRRLGVPGAWWGALLFAIHPVTASTVAWVSEQKNLLGLLFALVSLLLYLRFEASRRYRWYALSVIAFVAALLGKTSVVMVPCLMLAYEWRRAGTLRTAAVLRLAPFFAASLALGLVTVWFQVHRGMAGEPVPIGTYPERLAAAGCALWFYLAKAVAPVRLSMIYPRWDYAELSWWPAAAFVAVMLLLWHCRRCWRWAHAAWLGLGCFTIVLLPVLGFVPMAFMRFSLAADHFQYPALPALTAVAGVAVAAAIGRLPAAVLPAAAVAVGLTVLTMQQAAVYRGDETLWRATLRANPDAWVAHTNLGKILRDRGDHAAAAENFAAAVRLNPEDLNLRLLFGAALVATSDLAGAAAQYEAATRIKVDDFRAHNNLAEVLLRQGRAADALKHATIATTLRPTAAEPHYNLAAALNALARPAEAAEQAQLALRFDPALAAAHFELGAARSALGDSDAADAEFGETLRLDPQHAAAHNNLASSLNRRGRPADAAEHAKAAVAAEPNLARAHFNLGNAYYLQSMFPEAEREYREAIRLDPNFAEARDNLRAVLNRRP